MQRHGVRPSVCPSACPVRHWRIFTSKSGGDQWHRQDLVSRGHDDRVEVPKSPSGVGYGEECPLPSQLERAAGLLLWAWQVGNID